MDRITLDELIIELLKQKSAGVPGNTVMALPARDGNGRGSYVSFEVKLHASAVAKAEYEKGWTIAKQVSRGGVQVLMLG